MGDSFSVVMIFFYSCIVLIDHISFYYYYEQVGGDLYPRLVAEVPAETTLIQQSALLQ